MFAEGAGKTNVHIAVDTLLPIAASLAPHPQVRCLAMQFINFTTTRVDKRDMQAMTANHLLSYILTARMNENSALMSRNFSAMLIHVQ